jgi:hypothetical protein
MDDGIGIGHNQPPPDDGALLQRAGELVAAADKWGVIANADQAARLGDFIVQLRESSNDLDALERKQTGPLLTMVEAIRGRFRRPREGLKLALARARSLSADWLARERVRLLEEKAAADREAEQARQIAERQQEAALRTGRVEDQMTAAIAIEEADILAEKADKAPVRAVIRSDLAGKAISGRVTWTAELVDPVKARHHFAKHPKVLAAVDAAIVNVASKMASHDRDEALAPPGVRYVRKETAQ